MKITPSLLALMAAFFMASACSEQKGQEDESQSLRVSIIGSANNFAAPMALNGASALAAQATQLSLLSIDATGQIQPGLAQSWRVSNDGRNYIFRLGKAQWEDGRQITAGDVVAVLRRAVAPGSRHPLKPYLMAIENAPAVARNRKPQRMLGVQDVRADIVEIRLSAPMPELLRLLALPALAITRKGELPPAAGPYKIRAAGRDQIILARNSEYKGILPEAMRAPVMLMRAQDAAQALQQLQAGQSDIVMGGTVDGLSAARTAGPDIQLLIEPSYALYGYVARTIDGPLSDVRVRRALSLAIDRPALLARLFSLPAMVPTSLAAPPALLEDAQANVSDATIGADQNIRSDQAKVLLAEAGYDETRRLVLDVALPRGQIHRDILTIVSQYWAPLGIDVRISLRSDDSHAHSLQRGGYDLALIQQESPLALVAMFLENYRCQSALGGYCNPQADALLDAGWNSADLVTRNRHWQSAVIAHSENVPVITLFQPVRWILHAPNIDGLQPNIYGQHPVVALSHRKAGVRFRKPAP